MRLKVGQVIKVTNRNDGFGGAFFGRVFKLSEIKHDMYGKDLYMVDEMRHPGSIDEYQVYFRDDEITPLESYNSEVGTELLKEASLDESREKEGSLD